MFANIHAKALNIQMKNHETITLFAFLQWYIYFRMKILYPTCFSIFIRKHWIFEWKKSLSKKKKIGWNWKLKITNFVIIILMTIFFFFWGGLGGIVCIICFSRYLPYTLFGWSYFSLYYFVLWHEILGSTLGHFITLVIVKCFFANSIEFCYKLICSYLATIYYVVTYKIIHVYF